MRRTPSIRASASCAAMMRASSIPRPQLAPTESAPAAASAAFRLGCYGMQLEHLLSYVDRDRLHLVQFENCTRDAGAELARIYEFLGLDPTFRPDGIDRPVNAARAKKDDLSADTRAALVDAYTPDVRHLLTLDLGVDVSRWPNFAHLA